jgi:hypothetical protein
MRRTAVARALMIVAALLLLLSPFPAAAVPRYSARYQQACHLCHTNPTGAGQRTLYASQFLVPSEMVLHKLGFDDLAKIKPLINDDILVGADLRTNYMLSNHGRPDDGFFQMESNLTLNFQLDGRWSAYMSRGQSGTYEVWGKAQVLPGNGYLKLGRFQPAFGWRFSDHTMFVRQYLGFMPPTHTDVGLEAGLYPHHAELHASLLNGAQGSTMDVDNTLAVAGRAQQWWKLGPIAVATGGSIYWNNPSKARVTMGGPLGYLAWGRLIWVGEADWRAVRQPGSSRVTTFATSHELSFQLERGIDLLATYDFYDPDIDRKAGAVERFGIGFDSLVYRFVQLLTAVNVYDVVSGPDFRDEDRVEIVAQIHLLY